MWMWSSIYTATFCNHPINSFVFSFCRWYCSCFMLWGQRKLRVWRCNHANFVYIEMFSIFLMESKWLHFICNSYVSFNLLNASTKKNTNHCSIVSFAFDKLLWIEMKLVCYQFKPWSAVYSCYGIHLNESTWFPYSNPSL